MLNNLKKNDAYNEIIINKLKKLGKDQELTKTEKIIEALKSDLKDKDEIN